jgi:phage portal protein BeeE
VWPFRRKRQDQALFNVGNAWPGPATPSGVQVTPDTATRLSAVWGCVRLLADVVSELPVHVFAKGTRREVDPPKVLTTPPRTPTCPTGCCSTWWPICCAATCSAGP